MNNLKKNFFFALLQFDVDHLLFEYVHLINEHYLHFDLQLIDD